MKVSVQRHGGVSWGPWLWGQNFEIFSVKIKKEGGVLGEGGRFEVTCNHVYGPALRLYHIELCACVRARLESL